MSGQTFYTYELIDSRNNQVFYIGKGTENRMYNHVSMARADKKMNQYLKQRILEILNSSAKIKYKKILITESEHEAYRKEAELIEYYGLDNLCNIAAAGPNWSDMNCENLRKKLSYSLYDRWKNPEYRKKRSISTKNAWKQKSTLKKYEISRDKRYGPLIKEDVECPKCSELFHREYRSKTKKINQFCSRSCANSREWNDEINKLRSKKLQGSIPSNKGKTGFRYKSKTGSF